MHDPKNSMKKKGWVETKVKQSELRNFDLFFRFFWKEVPVSYLSYFNSAPAGYCYMFKKYMCLITSKKKKKNFIIANVCKNISFRDVAYT